jgi:ubiquinone/menaquinone biosynthesis C-methylase UbiE/predicted O-methyltransferase YrrM
MKDKIEILSIDIVDEYKELADLIYTLGSNLQIGMGWHYILDIVWIVKNIKDLPKGSLVLDAGGGNGLLQFVLASLGYKIISVDFSPRIPPQICKMNWDIVEIDSGIDFDNEYIRHLKENFTAAKKTDQSPINELSIADFENILNQNKKIIYYRSDFTNMELIKDGSIDCIVSLSALEHNNPESIKDAVREFNRVLKPNSRMLITVSAADKEDWFHEESKGWCFTEKSIVDQFGFEDYESNYNLYADLFDKLRDGKGLRENLAPFYFKSANNGMPWGIWNPKYQPVGIIKVKRSREQGSLQRTKNKEKTIEIANSGMPLNEPNIPGWFSTRELCLLYESIMYVKPQHCIEIGTYMGRSAYAICSALKKLGGKRRLLCIDTFASPLSKEYFEMDFMVNMMSRVPEVAEEYSNYERYPTTLDCLLLTLNRYPFMENYIDIKICNSNDLMLNNEMYDFALIDGDHTYDGVKNDFIKIKPFIKNGGVICFHDNSEHFPGVRQFIDEVRNMEEMVCLGEAGTAVTFQLDNILVEKIQVLAN